MSDKENRANVTPSQMSRNEPTTAPVVYAERDKRDSRVKHGIEFLSLYVPELLYASRPRVTFVTFVGMTALKAARASLAVNNRKAAKAFDDWLRDRPEFRPEWTRARDILWRRRKQLRRQERARRVGQ